MKHGKVSEVEGVRVTKVNSTSDNRGTFLKFHPAQEFEGDLDSIALSINPLLGTIRGLHFQVEPFAEEKLVTCISGAIFDVIVDLRPSSRTFGNWQSFELSAENAMQAYLPRGVAHGFQTLMPNSIIHYSLTSIYSPTSSFSIDPFGDLGIDWPLNARSIAERDVRGISFSFAAKKYADSIES